MICEEFKKKVADLFDVNVDAAVKKECGRHMSQCHDCKEYYDGLAEAYDALCISSSGASHAVADKGGNNHGYRYAVAAVAIFLVGLFVGWNHFFPAPATSNTVSPFTLGQAIQCVQNVGSFRMDIYARTTPDENFAHFDPKADFVKINIRLMRQDDTVFYSVEKAGGRTVVCDGKNQYLFSKGLFYKAGLDANILEHFNNLLYPERLLATQKGAIELSGKNKVHRSENDTTITLTTESYEKNGDMQQLLESGSMGDCKVTVENVFSKNDGLLRSVKVFVEDNGAKTLLLYIDRISYNVMLGKQAITALPDAGNCGWKDVDFTAEMAKGRLQSLQKESASQAAQRIVNAIISGDRSRAEEALYYYGNQYGALHDGMKGCAASDFVVRNDGNYAGVYVFYKLTKADGTSEKRHIALRNDNARRIWIADGGL